MYTYALHMCRNVLHTKTKINIINRQKMYDGNKKNLKCIVYENCISIYMYFFLY